jgi:methylenetetrahydrofolate reductase (NADPH)
MRIADLYGQDGPVLSFEFFPPKTDKGYDSLFRNIEELKELSPGFVSVTMGAGGSTRAKTLDLVIRIHREIDLPCMAHLPAIGFSRTDVDRILDTLEAAQVLNVLALRGDRPRDDPDFESPSDGFAHADELVAYIKERALFCIGGACHPERHPEAPDSQTDLANLKRKVVAGADFLVSQLFFDNQKFFDFERRARAAGIEVPIVPGIMPITSVAGIRRMVSLGGGSIPHELDRELQQTGEDDAATLEVGIEWATMQCQELLDNGVPGIHFYTLNKSPATRRVYQRLTIA